jgi:hypothetical protein
MLRTVLANSGENYASCYCKLLAKMYFAKDGVTEDETNFIPFPNQDMKAACDAVDRKFRIRRRGGLD